LVHEKIAEQYANKSIPSPGNPNYNEAWALIEAARRIAAIVQFGNLKEKNDREKLREALRLNLRIWTIIQAEQLVGENQLPEPIRVNILTLCKFIDEHTIGAMAEPTPEKAAVLIDINRNIASGLLGNPDDDVLEAPDDRLEESFGGDDNEAPTQPGDSLKIEA